jgi:exodeoxyribonuclease VII small subunit
MSDIKEQSFEAAFTELETLVQQMETGNLPLEEALALFERGTALVAHCNDLLDNAELKVRQLAPAAVAEDDEDWSRDSVETTFEDESE